MDAREAMNRYGRLIYAVALSYTKSHADSEDILQDVLLKYITRPVSFSVEAEERAWFIRCAENESKNALRYMKRHYKSTLDELVEAEVESIEERTDVLAAVLRLPLKLRRVIILYYYEGMDTSDVAEALRISVGSVKTRLTRARKTLREYLGEDYYEEL